MEIDHDPNEPKFDRGPGPWRWVLPLIAVVVIANIATREIDWVSVCLGLLVGGAIVAWAIDITGNKVPDFMKSKPPRSGRS